MNSLDFEHLWSLIGTVFKPRDDEKFLTIFTDLPDKARPDTDAWAERRVIAVEWYTLLRQHEKTLPFRGIRLCSYANVGGNNNDLPETVYEIKDGHVQPGINAEKALLHVILQSSSVVLALTELSATAPLKLLAKRYGFRGATLPGFTRAMIPTLLLDYERVHARVLEIKTRMDKAVRISVWLEAGGETYSSIFDTRYRQAHASGGLIRERGIVGNLPSGEAYIVPYEGERESDPSLSSGLLPVQFGDEIVVYKIKNNFAFEVISEGPVSGNETEHLRGEPAYGNIAEVGIGVLGEWGVSATGSVLIDEKLGLHIAFGRSDHFGGATGPSSFRDRANVVHIDRVYVPSLQPQIKVVKVLFSYPGEGQELVMSDGRLLV